MSFSMKNVNIELVIVSVILVVILFEILATQVSPIETAIADIGGNSSNTFIQSFFSSTGAMTLLFGLALVLLGMKVFGISKKGR